MQEVTEIVNELTEVGEYTQQLNILTDIMGKMYVAQLFTIGCITALVVCFILWSVLKRF